MRIRSGFSFRTCYGFLEDVIKEISTPYAPLTDRGSAYGFNGWAKLCEKNGKKPIFGIELAVTDSPNSKVLAVSHVTLIATNSLAPVNKALELAFSQFKYEPLLTYNDLNNIDDSVAIILGRRIEPELLKPGREFYYSEGPSTLPFMRRFAEDYGWKPMATSDNFYPAPYDKEPFRLLLGRQAGIQTWPQHILSDEELSQYASPEAFNNRDKLAARCTATMIKATLVHPETLWDLEEWCEHGSKDLGVDLNDNEYKSRYKQELKVIHQLGFDDYFLIIADLIQYSKKHMFVGPARGSSAGSLVCYLMGITTVDPIVHDLLFERFLDPNRTDLPDIDIDFSDQNRNKVFTYLCDKYGRDRVCKLGTISYIRERAFAKDIGAGLQVPAFKFEAVMSHIEKNEGNTTLEMALANTPDGVKLMREYPELAVVGRIEGHPRHHSTHAAGIVIFDRPVYEYVAMDARNDTAEIDKYDAEDLGILKIDALGLRQLSIFEDCLELLNKPHQWLIDQPLDDPAAFEVLNKKLFSGVFQYQGRSVQYVSSSFHVETFEDMVATTALARPGPLGAGGTEKWIAVRRGDHESIIEHPDFEPILGKTKGIVLYQEQVMQAGRQIGGMTWPRVTKLRKAVQYFGGAKGMEEFREEFMDGATKKNIPASVATRFWDDLLTYGSYAFNRSHAVAYSMISYWCCFLKAHHPTEYAAAMLNHEQDAGRQRLMLKEMKTEGVNYRPVDPERSGFKWQVDGKVLIGPISLVRGLGEKTAKEYIRARDGGLDLPKRALTLLKDPMTPLDSLTPIADRIEKNHPDLTEINIFSKPTPVDEVTTKATRDLMLFLRLIKATPRPDPKSGGTKMTCLMEDDTGEMKVFINSRKYSQFGSKMLDAGRPGKTLWAIKGSTPEGGGIVFADIVRHLGAFE